MSYFTAGRVVILTPDEARTVATTGNHEIALDQQAGLDVMAVDGALFCALRALASARAPQALSLFIRHWSVDGRGRDHLVGGEHADVLAGDELVAALAATDALLMECRMHPERIAAILEAADLPHGMDAESAEDDLREAASRVAPKTLADATEAFKADFPQDHLSAAGLHAWLLAFAAWLRHARETGQAVVHIAFL